MKLSLCIGHRGIASRAPENTLLGLRAAVEKGFSWVEVDVRPARDGVAVLSHDESLLRCGKADVLVSQTDSAVLSTIAVGAGFGGELAQQTVPTLLSALQMAAELNLGVVIEIKSELGMGVQSATAAVAALSQAPSSVCVLFSSFSQVAVNEALLQAPHIPRAFTCEKLPDDWRTLAARIQPSHFHCDTDFLTPQDVTAVKEAGLGVYAYTVNDAARAEALFDMGVDGVFTDKVLNISKK
ncbi:glycerophosphoryl diester phosphodiesterase [Candidatus Persebacteraceae bacterium Df01]|jgi:glycerophosphoryl diester phosphodiesterase|uniref:Glycerophosphoryl diester phosphodiesterase n=1 Tax=Candidatus Doriopsillibacter californiensis TaxID=2970740 RepID=A0ABT7QKX9_9GAMM|nr:glycerophosphoryl diester phosphodiesterase [Candidatus Persebacteraceae bacterium Df01]